MPQDPNLYGQRPIKKQRRETSLSSSLDFTAQLTSLMSNPASAEGSTGRTRPSKERKDDIFQSSKRPKRINDKDEDTKLVLKEVQGTEDEARDFKLAKRKMENKARLYEAMKRGDYVPKENEAAPLVDFDRKWAEAREGKDGGVSSTSDDDSDDDGEDGDGGGNEMVEYVDEFGRTRHVTKSEKEKLERRARRGLLGAEELERMSARPSAPGKLIYGDTVQSLAFNPEDADKMEELARKRDRSATPPEQTHYDADWEIRTKGVAFYKFSKDEETRAKEMRQLGEERQGTEQRRKERDDQREARKKEIEQRRQEMATRRAKRQADSFLDQL